MVMSVFESFSIDNIFPYALALAFLLGFAARSTGLPPMVNGGSVVNNVEILIRGMNL
jgi:hypothetical protein